MSSNRKNDECSLPAQLRRQRLIDFRTCRQIRYGPQRHVNRARDLLHLVVIDLLWLVPGAVIVFVHAVKEENDRNALARVVVVIAAEEEPVWISRIVVLSVVRQIQKRFVHVLAERA